MLLVAALVLGVNSAGTADLRVSARKSTARDIAAIGQLFWVLSELEEMNNDALVYVILLWPLCFYVYLYAYHF